MCSKYNYYITFPEIIHHSTETVGNATAPRVDSDSITATSVSIDWDEASHLSVTYIAQWRYVSIENSAWVSNKAEVSLGGLLA